MEANVSKLCFNLVSGYNIKKIQQLLEEKSLQDYLLLCRG